MKNTIIILILFAFYLPFNISAKTLILHPDACEGKDAINGFIVPGSNYGSSEDLDVYAWTQGGNLNINRAYLDFNLSSIPNNAVITSATLYLYYNPTNSGAYTHSGNNAFSIYRLTSPWLEDTINWNNQPSIDSSVIVNVPASTSGTQNYSINVSSLIQNIVNNSAFSYGLTMRLDDESPFNVVMFASSDHPDTSLHPMLVVTYNDPWPVFCNLHLQPGAESGKDAIDGYIVPNTNYGTSEDLDAYAWTQGGNLNINRGYIAFDLSSIDSSSIVNNATLSLFYNPTNSGGYTHSGNNAFTLYRILSPWTESNITWNNQPLIDSVFFTTVPASTSGTQDYTIDITGLVQQMISDPIHSYGFCLRLDDETPFNVVMFASSDHPNCNLHPILDINYSLINNISESKGKINNLIIFPNPVSYNYTVSLPASPASNCSIEISDLTGKCVYKKENVKTANVTLNKGNLAPGTYFLEMKKLNEVLGTGRLIIN
jgi:hypothetical protein